MNAYMNISEGYQQIREAATSKRKEENVTKIDLTSGNESINVEDMNTDQKVELLSKVVADLFIKVNGGAE
ncbi:hypothetical protein [Priestia megaterium]|uniref:hypothetical protein n=1 Tax=Priestia megaterium TaxID=1404 RepID=UPI002ACF00EA|nr:hypothetical protein [Priestia megaterium]